MAQGNGESKISLRRIKCRERDGKALAMKKAGATLDVIAQALGYSSPSSVYLAIQRAMQRTGNPETAEEMRKLVTLRLEAMLMSLWPKVQKGDIPANDAVLRITNRLCKLYGLDAPTHSIIETDQPEEKARKIRETLGMMQGSVPLAIPADEKEKQGRSHGDGAT
jgi:hypothetical protein